MQDALSIQDRFSAERVYARTGKGFLKSAGVKEIGAAKVITPSVLDYPYGADL